MSSLVFLDSLGILQDYLCDMFRSYNLSFKIALVNLCNNLKASLGPSKKAGPPSPTKKIGDLINFPLMQSSSRNDLPPNDMKQHSENFLKSASECWSQNVLYYKKVLFFQPIRFITCGNRFKNHLLC